MPKSVKLSVAKGDKLPVSRGAGLTAKPAKTGALSKMAKPTKKK